MQDVKPRVPRRRPLPIFSAVVPVLSSTSSMSSSDDTHHNSPTGLLYPYAPHSPPTAPVLHRNFQSEPALPPTTHNLAPKERTKLMRSTRKLGQLLGTTPHLIELPLSSGSRSPPIQHDTPTVTAATKTSRRTTLAAVPTTSMSLSPPASPLAPAQLSSKTKSKAPPQSTRLAPPALRLSISDPPSHDKRRSSASSIATSLPPSPSPADPPDLAAQRRLKMDKLKRTLGENVPAELVFGVRPRVYADPDATRPKSEADPGRKSVGMSLWKKASQGVLPSTKPKPKAETQPVEVTPPTSPGTPVTPALSDTVRAVNVRRATKMAQVFGTPPPHALYQITNTENREKGKGRERGKEGGLDKKAMEGLAYMLDHDRDSLYDLLSTVSTRSPENSPPDASPNADVDSEEQVDWPYEDERRRQLAQASTLSPPDTLRGAPSLSSLSTYVNENGNANRPGSGGISPNPKVEGEGEVAFQARRKRATKLSRFFGVGYHDLFETMLTYPAVDPRPRPFLIPQLLPHPGSQPPSPSPSPPYNSHSPSDVEQPVHTPLSPPQTPPTLAHKPTTEARTSPKRELPSRPLPRPPLKQHASAPTSPVPNGMRPIFVGSRGRPSNTGARPYTASSAVRPLAFGPDRGRPRTAGSSTEGMRYTTEKTITPAPASREARTHRRSASLSLLAAISNPAQPQPQPQPRASTPSYSRSQSYNLDVPPSPPPFAALWQPPRRASEDSRRPADMDRREDILVELLGGEGDGRETPQPQAQTQATVQVQGKGLKRVVSVSREDRRKRAVLAHARDSRDMEGVLNRLRELPGGR